MCRGGGDGGRVVLDCRPGTVAGLAGPEECEDRMLARGRPRCLLDYERRNMLPFWLDDSLIGY
jgi:hypothetical protein